jgi:hypothetical protein
MTVDGSPKAGRREWLGLVVLALPTLLLSLDFSALYLALPHLSADLGASRYGTNRCPSGSEFGIRTADSPETRSPDRGVR